MSRFRKLVSRGSAVMREWHSYEGVDDSSRVMIGALAANMLTTMCGEEMQKLTKQEMEDRALAMRIALTSAFQIGRSSVRKCARKSA